MSQKWCQAILKFDKGIRDPLISGSEETRLVTYRQASASFMGSFIG